MVTVTVASHFQPNKVVGGSTTEAKQITMQPVPKVDDAARGNAGCQFHRQRTMTGPNDILAELLLVRGENADAASAA
jgi:hypothetical protein